ncbi:hypothetical protein QYE76_026479 [Lolium multiflorum]|uniref:Uncharacterized protein n=1 Tax=Lolium multiflorum TaxID=4521 RepID=A0AAD8RHC6_LOLMU|nr:hypothetical protein QYE76_026479 [Lolium multiflorum]
MCGVLSAISDVDGDVVDVEAGPTGRAECVDVEKPPAAATGSTVEPGTTWGCGWPRSLRRDPQSLQWDGDEVEVVHADDSAEISTADMNVWEAAGQEPLSGINLDDCERIDVMKDGVRLVLATGLTV